MKFAFTHGILEDFEQPLLCILVTLRPDQDEDLSHFSETKNALEEDFTHETGR
jgi:hypothetical protein